MFKQWTLLLLVSVTSAVQQYVGLVYKEKANRALYRFCRGILLCVHRWALLWQHLYSDRVSSLNLDLTAFSLCHTGAGGGSWEEYLQASTTVLEIGKHTHGHTHTHKLSQYIPAKSSIVVWQEEPRESNSQMCPLALMAASADWRGKTPWRIIHLNSHLAPARDKLIDICWSLAKHARPLIQSTHARSDGIVLALLWIIQQ